MAEAATGVDILPIHITSSASAVAEAATGVDILSKSLPFIQRFRNKTIVVKYGGAAMTSPTLQSSVINNLILLSYVGLRPVLVHAGGLEINSWLLRLGVQPRFHNSLCVTDALFIISSGHCRRLDLA